MRPNASTIVRACHRAQSPHQCSWSGRCCNAAACCGLACPESAGTISQALAR
jgi:hypothetical protein